MSGKSKTAETSELRLKALTEELKSGIRKFRAKRELANEPISSDEKAVYQLLRRGLMAEGIAQ